MEPISSSQNERVKLVRALQSQTKARRRAERLVLEGVRLIGDALDNGVLPDFVLYDDALSESDPAFELLERLSALRVIRLPVVSTLMRDMADTETPQGILGVFPWPSLEVPEIPSLVLVADQWRDPGNLGTLIRTIAAAGVDLLVTTPGTVDTHNPKTIRAGMGAHYRVPLLALNWEEIAVRFAQYAFYLADAHGTTLYHAVDWSRPSVIVVGGEAHGLGEAALTIPHTLVRIPMVDGAESLNAAVSASLLVYEARRHVWRG